MLRYISSVKGLVKYTLVLRYIGSVKGLVEYTLSADAAIY